MLFYEMRRERKDFISIKFVKIFLDIHLATCVVEPRLSFTAFPSPGAK